jgi:hypothetical protein
MTDNDAAAHPAERRIQSRLCALDLPLTSTLPEDTGSLFEARNVARGGGNEAA